MVSRECLLSYVVHYWHQLTHYGFTLIKGRITRTRVPSVVHLSYNSLLTEIFNSLALLWITALRKMHTLFSQRYYCYNRVAITRLLPSKYGIYYTLFCKMHPPPINISFLCHWYLILNITIISIKRFQTKAPVSDALICRRI